VQTLKHAAAEKFERITLTFSQGAALMIFVEFSSVLFPRIGDNLRASRFDVEFYLETSDSVFNGQLSD
jgi:hypothetical protein